MKSMKSFLALLLLLIPLALLAQDKPEDSIQVEAGRTADQYYDIGNWYAERNQFFKAIAYYKAALEKRETFCMALINLGRAYKSVNRHQEAIAAYEKALSLSCEQDFIHLNLGNAHVEAGNLTEGIAAYDKFIELQPYDPDGYLNKGITLYKAGRYSQAAASFEKLILLEPDNSYFIFQTARCYAHMEDHDRTARKVIAAYNIDPNVRYALMADDDFKDFRKSDQFRRIMDTLIQEEPQE